MDNTTENSTALGLGPIRQSHILPGRSIVSGALRDIAQGIRRREFWIHLGWLDIRQRYRRSTLGPFWVTLSMVINVLAIGVVWGAMFGYHSREFFPYLCAGIIAWNLILSIVSEGCQVFIQAGGYIKQTGGPYSSFLFWMLWRNCINLAHNIVVFPAIVLVLGISVGPGILILPLGFAVLLLNLAWIALFLGILSCRFRDIPVMVQNLMGILFFVSPVFWKVEVLQSRRWIADFNPITHMLALVREPLLGHWPSALTWSVTVGMAVVGWGISLPFFGRFRARLAYWV